MDKLKYVVGEYGHGKPAHIYFNSSVSEVTAEQFISEFRWLEENIKPSKIVISINSSGGSVIHGMSIYSVIANCSIETEVINEGVAASIASIIWMAGTRSYMRDYSLLMIHNPFYSKSDGCVVASEDEDTKQMVAAFKTQIETIYHKRLGLSLERIAEIMEGKKGCDGTFLTAQQAVEAGFITADRVIPTSPQICNMVKDKISGLNNALEIQEAIESISNEIVVSQNQPTENTKTIHNQIINSKPSNKMNEGIEFAFGSVCAQLGFDSTADTAHVTNRIADLVKAETKLKDVQDALNALTIQKEGVEANLANVQDELADVKNQLQKYREAEKAQRDAEILQLVENAIADGKITEESKDKWVEMANTNLEIVQATLASIEKREKISESIAKDPENVDNAINGMTEAEKRMAEAVNNAVGKDFKFKTLD